MPRDRTAGSTLESAVLGIAYHCQSGKAATQSGNALLVAGAIAGGVAAGAAGGAALTVLTGGCGAGAGTGGTLASATVDPPPQAANTSELTGAVARCRNFRRVLGASCVDRSCFFIFEESMEFGASFRVPAWAVHSTPGRH